MVEIKFRAWDKKRECMFQVTEMNFKSNGRVYSVSPNQGEDFYLVGDEVYLIPYTNCIDKEGREVYKGDIVKARYYDEVEEEWRDEIGVVDWESSCFTIEKPSKIINPDVWEDSELLCLLSDAVVEVIGNIYENEELINNKE
jgi:uncharacterized phage protein (TIGR01671 family)